LLLTFRFQASQLGDRGLKKYLFPQGRAMVCQPASSSRAYIPQYILSDNNGERFLKCQLDPSVRSLRFRVFPFDANDRLLQVMEVEDPVHNPGLSTTVPLPLNTAYVSLGLLEVNDKSFSCNMLEYSVVKMLIYLSSTVLMTLLEGLMIQQCLLYFAELFFAYSSVVKGGYGYTLFLSVIIGIVYALCVLRTHFIKGSRIQK
jgi:hypothetical protein